MSEDKASLESDLEKRLRDTVTALQESTIDEVKHFFHFVEAEVSKTIMQVADSLVSRLRNAQNEFNLEESIRDKPWIWLLGALAAGSAAGLLRKDSGASHESAKPLVKAEDLH